jgi:hypothetical protein
MRPAPAHAGLHAVRDAVAVVRDFLVSVVRDFVVAAYRDGRIRTRGLPAGVRVALLTAIAISLALFVSIIAADAWRTIDPVPLTGRSQVLRGTLVPGPLVPITFALISFAAGLCISGALRAGPFVSVGVGTVYCLIATFVHELTVGDDLLHRLAGWAIPGVIVLFVAVRFTRPRPTLELLAALGLVGLTFADAHRLMASVDGASGSGFLTDQTNLLLSDVLFLSAPLIVVAALAVVDFGVSAARWGLRFVDVRLGQRTVLVLVALLGLWRVRDLAVELAGNLRDDAGAELRGLVGAAALTVALVGLAQGVRRASGQALAGEDPQETSGESARVALPLAMWLLAVSVVLAAMLLLVQGSLSFLPADQVTSVQQRVIDLLGPVGDFGGSVWWDLVRAAVALGLAWLLARRGRAPAAVFVGAVGVVLAVNGLTDPGRALEDWGWTLRAVDLIAVGTLVVLLVRWALGGDLSERRSEWALYLLLLTGLLRQGDFVSDPFAPFLAFTGGAFVLFGLIWGFATGLAWGNDSSPSLPRLSRAQLLLGYQVLSVAILHWYLVNHDLESLELLTESHPGTGTALLGQPLLLVLILTAIAAALADVPIRTTDDDVAGASDDGATAAAGSPVGLDVPG